MQDIGKIGMRDDRVSDETLLRPGGLSPDERQILEEHAPICANILGDSKPRFLAMDAEITLNHHERWDGSSYSAG